MHRNSGNRFYMYGVVGELAAFAASCELESGDIDATATLALA